MSTNKKKNKKKSSSSSSTTTASSTIGNQHHPHEDVNNHNNINNNNEVVVVEEEATTTTTTTTSSLATSNHNNTNNLEQLVRQQMILSPSSQQQQQQHHAFWDTQPMPHHLLNSSSSTQQQQQQQQQQEQPIVMYEEGPIIPNKDISEIRTEPYTMPNGYEWDTIDMNNTNHVQELYNLLSNNYVEDDDELFRFDYSINFLKWALQPPNYNPQFIFGVRTSTSTSNNTSSSNSNNKKLVAFISGIPTTIQIKSNTIPVVEINFLCIHKKLRSKRLAPVLIKEITRRVNLTGIFQAVYTSGTVLPVPISSARYYHRNLNPKKLVDIGFSRIGHRMTMARMMKLYKLPEIPITNGIRPMIEDDVSSVHVLLNEYLSQFQLKILFTIDEIRHWLLPRENVIDTYVVCNDTNDIHRVTDLISFYHLPSNILHHPVDTKLYAAYSFYNVATTIPIVQLMKDALIIAKNYCHCDVYNALNLMNNYNDFINELKFGIGDGTLQYYIYNYTLGNSNSSNTSSSSSSSVSTSTNTQQQQQQQIPSNQLGIVLL